MNTASYELIENYLGVAFVKQLREIFAHVPQLLSIKPQTIHPLQPTPSWFASLSAVALAAKISDTGRCLNNQPNCVFRICLTSSALFSASVFALCRLSLRSVPPQFPLCALRSLLLGLRSMLCCSSLSTLCALRSPLCTLWSLQQYGTEQGTSQATERRGAGAPER